MDKFLIQSAYELKNCLVTRFQLLYRRVRSDKTGFETRKLYNLVWFMMMDDKSDGTANFEISKLAAERPQWRPCCRNLENRQVPCE